MKIQKTIKNHYIPIFYTKKWANIDGKIIEFSRPYSESQVIDRRKYPSATGFRKNIYTLKNLSDETTTWIEDFLLKTIDDKAAVALEYIIKNSEADTDELRNSFACLLFSLLRRNPEHIIKMRSIWDEGHSNVMSTLEHNYLELRSSQDPQTFESFRKKYELNSADAGFAHFVYLMMSGDGIIEHLINCEWKFVEIQKGSSLLTSDRPVIFNSGAAYQDFHILFACGPNNIFIATNNIHEMNRITKNKNKLLRHYNDIVSRQAKDYVYGCDISHLKFIDNRLNKGIVQCFF